MFQGELTGQGGQRQIGIQKPAVAGLGNLDHTIGDTTASNTYYSHEAPVGKIPVSETLLNGIFSPKTYQDCSSQTPMVNCGYKELPCFFEFLGNCSPRKEDDLVYGLYCLRHTNATSRTFAAMGTQTTVDMQPISLKTATCEKNMFLWSFLTNLDYSKAKELVSFMSISTNDASNLSKFMMAVSESYTQRSNSEEYQRLHQYLSAYCQSAIACIQSIPDRDKILIPVFFTKQFLEDNSSNKLIDEILNLKTKGQLSFEQPSVNLWRIYIPLTMFNLLDQINLLSFRMYCGIGKVSLAPNCGITNERILIGEGLAIRNALSSVEISKLRAFFPDAIYKALRCIHGDSVHFNFDILVLCVVPANNVQTCVNPQIFIAKRKFQTTTLFDIDKLDILLFC